MPRKIGRALGSREVTNPALGGFVADAHGLPIPPNGFSAATLGVMRFGGSWLLFFAGPLRLLHSLHSHGCGFRHAIDGLDGDPESHFPINRRGNHVENLREGFRRHTEASPLVIADGFQNSVHSVSRLETCAQWGNAASV